MISPAAPASAPSPPTGDCLCTIAECLNVLGTPMCQPPLPLGASAPPAPTGTRVTVQTGLSIPKIGGGTMVYNGTIDASIDTQYIASWNQMQVSNLWWARRRRLRAPTRAPHLRLPADEARPHPGRLNSPIYN